MSYKENILNKYFFAAKNERVEIPFDEINKLLNSINAQNLSLNHFHAKTIINLKYLIMTSTLITTLVAGIYFFNIQNEPAISDTLHQPDISAVETFTINKNQNKKTFTILDKSISNQKTYVKPEKPVISSINITQQTEPEINKFESITQLIITQNDTAKNSNDTLIKRKTYKNQSNNSKHIASDATLNVNINVKNESNDYAEKRNGYDKIFDFNFNNYKWAMVLVDHKCGFIDTTGKEIIKPVYKIIGHFGEYKENWAWVLMNKKIGFIDTSGREIVKPVYDAINYFDEYKEGWALIKKNKRYGFIDTTGYEIVSPVYKHIYNFGEYKEDWALIRLGKKYGFINTTGNEIVKPVYQSIGNFDEYKENWALIVKDKKFGFIDISGNEIVAPIYDQIYNIGEFKDNWMKVKKNGKELFIDSNGEEVF
ncbi:MAG: WG repeat-containing protein [Chlorobi bacterium]|nr:WG repeat-containing protein [Chlorobiota bacterium]